MIALALLASLQLAPEPSSKPPRLRVDATLPRSNDYPEESLRNNEYGIVSVLLEVSAEGSVERCEITESSGFTRLDKRTCSLLTARAKFDPASDISGQPVKGEYRAAYSWGVDAHQPRSKMDLTLQVSKVPDAYKQAIEVRVVFNGLGSVISCDVTTSSGADAADATACNYVKSLTLPSLKKSRSSVTTAAIRYFTVHLTTGGGRMPTAK